MGLMDWFKSKSSYVGYCPVCGDDAWCGSYEDEDSMDCTWECLGCGFTKIEKE